MSKTIKYNVKFLSDWHCGSGLSSGIDLDLLVIKDVDNLPYIPGKTIKGLVREAVEEIGSFDTSIDQQKILQTFGSAYDKPEESQMPGCLFFHNAVLKEELRKEIKERKLYKYLYRSIASTAIDKDGVAEEHTLRKMETTVPCELEGEILEVPDDFDQVVEKGLKFVKRLGQNRNRGLGRCIITVTSNQNQEGNQP